MSNSRQLLLIRHGQSEWNAQGRWQGQADPPLTALGLHQAAQAAAVLPPVTAVAGSTLIRAAETARILAQALNLAPPMLIAEMIERDAGEYSGLTRDQIEEQFPGNLAADIWPSGWEPDTDLVERATRGIQQLMDQVQGDSLACVTHGGVIYSIEASLGAPWERIGNLGCRVLNIADDAWTLGPRLDLLPADDQTIPDHI